MNRTFKRKTFYLGACLALILAGLACFSDDPGKEIENTTGGNSTFGSFQIWPAWNGLTGAPVTIAQGARFNVRVWDWEDINPHEPAKLTNAFTEDESIVKVISREGDNLILEGVAPGVTRIQLEGSADGSLAVDFIDVAVAAPAAVEFDQPCGAISMISGHQNYLTHSFRGADGGNYYGYGLDYLSINDPTQAKLLPELGTERFQVIDVDAQASGTLAMTNIYLPNEVALPITAPKKITNIQFYPEYSNSSNDRHPTMITLLAEVTLEGDIATCPVLRYKLVSKNPKVCSLEDLKGAVLSEEATTLDKVRIVTKTAGLCIIAMSVVSEGLEAEGEFTFEADIVPAPDREIEFESTGSGGGDFD